MSRISIKWGGTIDKFIGDAIMIFFGDPNSQGENQDAVNCVMMAMEMLKKLEELRKEWRKKGLALPLNARIGIHTGICTVGNFGSEDRLDYTIIGNGVNLASRLESNANPNSILISEDTYLHVQEEIECKKYKEFKVKGISYPVQTYNVEGMVNNKSSQENGLNQNIPGFSLNLNLEHIEDRAFVKKSLLDAINQLEINN